ncbi:unnamed protein product, partial [marine sediment metagenome]
VALLSACLIATLSVPDSAFAQAAAEGKASVTQAEEPAGLTPEQRDKAVATMRRVLAEEERWVKVHAAEHLLGLDYPQGVLEEIEKELEKHGDEPEYRIGIWRVLARGTNQKKARLAWIDKIKEVALDAEAPDQLHAMETLGKLGVTIDDEELGPVEEAAEKTDQPMGVYAQWVLVNSGQDEGGERLAEYLDSPDAIIRNTAAYVFSYLKKVSPAVKDKIAATADKEPTVAMITAAALHGQKDQREKRLQQLVEYTKTGTVEEQRSAALGLARAG